MKKNVWVIKLNILKWIIMILNASGEEEEPVQSGVETGVATALAAITREKALAAYHSR